MENKSLNNPIKKFFLAILINQFLIFSSAANCLVNTNALNFGIYDVFSNAPNDSNSQIQIICRDQTANVALSVDKGIYGTIQKRIMKNNQEELYYNVYWDSARNLLAGDGINGQTYSASIDEGSITIPLYGRIFPNQDASGGNYTDRLIITINF